MNPRLRLALLFLPVLLQLCLFRLMEYSLARSGAWTADFADTLSGILLSELPGFLVVLLLPVLVYAVVRLRFPLASPALAAVPALLAVLLVFTVVPSTLLPSQWLEPPAIKFIFLDNLIVVLAGAGFFLLLEHATGGVYRVGVVAAHLFAGIASLLLSMNFGYFLKTGICGEWLLFLYAMETLHETRDVIASEVDWMEVAMLCLPVLIALGPVLLNRLQSVRNWNLHPQPAARAYFWLVIGTTLAALGIHSVADHATSRTGVSLFANFVRETTSVRETPPSDLGRVMPAFDAAGLRLAPGREARKMNVVMVVLESIRADALTPYNRELPTAPFLDSLAASGLLVEQMYAPVAHTTKALVPLVAGVYPSLQLHFPEARPGGLPARALPDLLAPLGYASAFFSPAPLEYENKKDLLRNMGYETLRGAGAFDTTGFDRIGYFGFEDRIVINPAMDWVDGAVADAKPFFLTILTLTAHHPYRPPARFANRQYDSTLPDDYLNAVASTDAFLRELYAEFARRNLLEETLFIFVSDHGEAFREHGMTGHNQVLWDEVLHVPCVLHHPLLFGNGRRVTGPRSQVDVLPTVAELLGLAILDGEIPGRSLLDDFDQDRVLYHSAWNSRQGLALRDGSTKYLYFYRRSPMKAFQYTRDPRERENIGEILPEVLVREIERRLVAWRWSVQSAY